MIGARSIGTSLACMVSAGLGARQPITVRPVGHPFARRVAADPARIDRTADAYALVDEGPGLSGSSLAAVARWLLDAGVAEERLHIFAAHRRGPGPQADEDVRALWRRAEAAGRLHVTTFDDLVLRAAAPSTASRPGSLRSSGRSMRRSARSAAASGAPCGPPATRCRRRRIRGRNGASFSPRRVAGAGW